MQTTPRRITPTPNPESRRAFTLVELLIVIAIIAILAGLVTYAAQGAITKGRDAAVTVEIRELETGIASFKATYGVEPPSTITLSENGSWNAASKAKIRSIFGSKFDFNQPYDFDFDGNPTNSAITLNGSECLLFFLAGPCTYDSTSGVYTPRGFSKNPSKPFQIDTGERTSFLEAKPERISQSSGSALPEYQAIYDRGIYAYIHYESYATPTTSLAGTGMSGPYTLPGGTSFHKPNSFQIIAAGVDLAFGTGGAFDPENGDALSLADSDNITNIKTGRLAN